MTATNHDDQRYNLVKFVQRYCKFGEFLKSMPFVSHVFTVRRYALHGLSYRNSIRPSVTLVHCVHMVRPTIMISSPIW